MDGSLFYAQDSSGRSVLIESSLVDQMFAHCIREFPLEACGLLGLDQLSGQVAAVYPCKNVAESAKLYTVDPRDFLRVDRQCESEGLVVGGVYHSHTHTAAYPSPTDLAAAPDPNWFYFLVSLRDPEPVLRSFELADETIREDSITFLR